MINGDKIIRLYNAAIERGHPDPESGVLGRAFLTGRKADYNKNGKVGLFGVSENKAKTLGFDALENVDTNFEAMMTLDLQSFEQDSDVRSMLTKTAGVTGGVNARQAYLKKLDAATKSAKDSIIWEDGKASSFKEDEVPVEQKIVDDNQPIEDIKEDIKQAVAENQSASINTTLSGVRVDPKKEIDKYVQLLREAVDALV